MIVIAEGCLALGERDFKLGFWLGVAVIFVADDIIFLAVDLVVIFEIAWEKCFSCKALLDLLEWFIDKIVVISAASKIAALECALSVSSASPRVWSLV